MAIPYDRSSYRGGDDLVLPGIIGSSPAMVEVFRTIRRIQA